MPYNYSPAGHVINDDVNLADNEDLKSIIVKGQKFREPRSFTWRRNFIHIMNSVEDYANRWENLKKNWILDDLTCTFKTIHFFFVKF